MEYGAGKVARGQFQRGGLAKSAKVDVYVCSRYEHCSEYKLLDKTLSQYL